MSEEPPDEGTREVPTDRESPVGTPVIRGDEAITGEHARRAVRFDPDDPESLAQAAHTVKEFAAGLGEDDRLYMLRGAAACAALVRGEGSYKDAAARASAVELDAEGNGEVTVSFIRKWARVHDLPQSVRRKVALGQIAPTAAKHIARVSGDTRLLLAWATIDGDLTVRQVRRVASAVNDGLALEQVLADEGVTLGQLSVTLPREAYRDLRRRAAIENVEPGVLIADALAGNLDGA